MRDLAEALRELWKQRLVHRDVKPQNLLLSSRVEDPSCILKVADFGFARALGPQLLAETLCGSPLYMAPEILLGQRYDAKADLWSCGAVLYEMVVGKPPFSGQTQLALLQNIQRHDVVLPEKLKPKLSPECRSLIFSLMRRNPVERMSFEEFFSHPFVSLSSTHMEGEESNVDTTPRAIPAGPTSHAQQGSSATTGERSERTRRRKTAVEDMAQKRNKDLMQRLLGEIVSHEAALSQDDEDDSFILVPPRRSYTRDEAIKAPKVTESRESLPPPVGSDDASSDAHHHRFQWRLNIQKCHPVYNPSHEVGRGPIIGRAEMGSSSGRASNRYGSGKSDASLVTQKDIGELNCSMGGYNDGHFDHREGSSEAAASRIYEEILGSASANLSVNNGSFVKLDAVPWQSASRFEFLTKVADLLESMASLSSSFESYDAKGVRSTHESSGLISEASTRLSFLMAALHVYTLALFSAEGSATDSQTSLFERQDPLRDSLSHEARGAIARCDRNEDDSSNKSHITDAAEREEGDLSLSSGSLIRHRAIHAKVAELLDLAEASSRRLIRLLPQEKGSVNDACASDGSITYDGGKDRSACDTMSTAHGTSACLEETTKMRGLALREEGSLETSSKALDSSAFVPNPWSLAHRAALDWAIEAASEELLGNYDKSAELYARSGMLLYFFGVEIDGMSDDHEWIANVCNGHNVQGTGLDPPKISRGLRASVARGNGCEDDEVGADRSRDGSRSVFNEEAMSHLRLCAGLVAGRWAACRAHGR